jgi:hypothetical protein
MALGSVFDFADGAFFALCVINLIAVYALLPAVKEEYRKFKEFARKVDRGEIVIDRAVDLGGAAAPPLDSVVLTERAEGTWEAPGLSGESQQAAAASVAPSAESDGQDEAVEEQAPAASSSPMLPKGADKEVSSSEQRFMAPSGVEVKPLQGKADEEEDDSKVFPIPEARESTRRGLGLDEEEGEGDEGEKKDS